MSLSNAAAKGVLDQCLNGTAFAAAGSGFMALAANGGAEVSGTGYARQAISYGTATTANPSVATETSELDFGTVGGDWTPSGVDEGRVYSALTGGTLLFTDTDTSITYASGNRAFVAANHTVSFGTLSQFSAAYCQDILEWLVNSGATPARARYLGLANSGTELSGTGYARLDTDGLFPAATTADPAVSAFASAATFTASAGAAWGAFNQMQLFSATSGGSALITISVSSQTIASGDEVTVQPTVTLT